MSRKAEINIYALVVVILFGVVFVNVLRSEPSITGFTADTTPIPIHEPIPDELREFCGKYFGDQHCDDTPENCGVYYEEGVSLSGCNECQIIGKEQGDDYTECPPGSQDSNCKPGFDFCGIVDD